MFCLADTHIALWVVEDSNRIPKKIKSMLKNPDNCWYLSYASVWEVALKHAKHPSKIPLTAKQFHDACVTSGFKDLPIRLEHIYATEYLPNESVHSDPFDRMLLTQAHNEDFLLVTQDEAFKKYKDPHILIA